MLPHELMKEACAFPIKLVASENNYVFLRLSNNKNLSTINNDNELVASENNYVFLRLSNNKNLSTINKDNETNSFLKWSKCRLKR